MKAILMAILLGAIPAICNALPDKGPSIEEARTYAIGLIDTALNNLRSDDVNKLFPRYYYLIAIRKTIDLADILNTQDARCDDKTCAYVLGGKAPIHICEDYRMDSDIQRVAEILIHEGYHASGLPDWQSECFASKVQAMAMISAGKSPTEFTDPMKDTTCFDYDNLRQLMESVGKQKILKIGSKVKFNVKVIKDGGAEKGKLDLLVMSPTGKLPAAGFVSATVESLKQNEFYEAYARTRFRVAFNGGTVDFSIVKGLVPPTIEDFELLANGED